MLLKSGKKQGRFKNKLACEAVLKRALKYAVNLLALAPKGQQY